MSRLLTTSGFMLTVRRWPQPMETEATVKLEALELRDSFQEEQSHEDVRHMVKVNSGANSEVSCKPLSQWQCLTPRGVPSEMQIQSRLAPKKVTVSQGTTSELSRFQRFIRRMEGAGPKVILDRLKEDWQWTAGGDVDEEVCSNSVDLYRALLMVECCALVLRCRASSNGRRQLRYTNCRLCIRLKQYTSLPPSPHDLFSCRAMYRT